MRIIGYIDHPQLKITVFKMDNRLSVKFENSRCEQTYKFGADEQLDSLEAVRRLVDEEFLNAVQIQLQQMHQNRLKSLARNFPPADTGAFEDII